MEQTFARLGLNIQKPVQEISQPTADLNMKQENAVLEIHQENGVLTMDASAARENIDLRGPLRRTRDHADFGYQRYMEAVAEISTEGDRLRAIENKGNPIADLAYENSGIYEATEIIAPGSIIGNGIEIHYEAKKPVIQFHARGVSMDPVIKKPILNYTRGIIEGYIQQKNSLKIEVAAGALVDQRR
jgi:hypothetical protein